MATITFATIVGNEAYPGNEFGYPGGAGGILASGEATLANSVVAHNRGAAPDVGGTVQARTLVIGDISGSGLVDGADGVIVAADAGLALDDDGVPVLADLGGPTATVALLPESPAIDAADPDTCPVTEGRGVRHRRDRAGDEGHPGRRRPLD